MISTLEQLNLMANLQHRINKKVDADWINSNRDWLLASLMEGAEAIDHHGWKWWKKQEPDMAQLQMELIDIWHFQLSHMVSMATQEVPLITIEEICGQAHAMLVDEELENSSIIEFDGTLINYDQKTIVENFKLFIGLNAAGRSPLSLFYKLLEQAGLNTDDLYQLYVAKNVLNTFRQNNGYLQGTYFKIWHGKEDNEVLTSLMTSVDWNDGEVFQRLYSKLFEEYALVLDTIS
jgi:dimeric dUTPase (all-alpha-NTP-PPase superfamily)